MATYGEIVEPGSRTAWEDWDDLSPPSSLVLEWQLNVAVPEVIDSFLAFEGKYLYDCLTQQNKLQLELINSIKEVGLHLFKLPSSNQYLCVIKDYNLVQSSEMVELLKPYLSISKEVLTLQTKPLAEYQSLELSNHNCLFREVCTTSPSKSDLHFPKLEQPNMISGLSAGVISLREQLGLSGKAIVVYIEHPEEYQLEEVQMLLKKFNITPNNSKPSNVLNSNLYL